MAALIAGRTSAPSPVTATASGATAPSTVSEPAKRISKAHIEATLAKLADEKDEDYDWNRSIASSCDFARGACLKDGRHRPQQVAPTGDKSFGALQNVAHRKTVGMENVL